MLSASRFKAQENHSAPFLGGSHLLRHLATDSMGDSVTEFSSLQDSLVQHVCYCALKGTVLGLMP